MQVGVTGRHQVVDAQGPDHDGGPSLGGTFPPNRSRHIAGTDSVLPSPESRELRSAPKNTPRTTIHSQPIFGGFPSWAFLAKYSFVYCSNGSALRPRPSRSRAVPASRR